MPFANKLINRLLLALIIVLPFHTLFVVWLTHNFGNLNIWFVWKEIIIAIIALTGIIVVVKDAKLRKWFFAKPYNKLAITYILLCTIYLIIQRFGFGALVGYAINTRFLIIFLCAQITCYYLPSKYKIYENTLLIIATIVAILALLQATVLPAQQLVWFGYDLPGESTAGIPPAVHYVSSGSNLVRAQSTLRGPNVLGAFLLLPMLILIFNKTRTANKQLFIGVIGVIGLAILLTYSRSSLLGLVVVVCAGALIRINPNKTKEFIKKNTYILFASFLITTILIFTFSKTPLFNQVVLHNNPNVAIAQSNEKHTYLTIKAIKDIVNNPLGGGLASAGPASTIFAEKGKIAENYFLQIGQELGWMGVILFVTLQFFVVYCLYKAKEKDYALPVFLAMISLIITNLFLHNWADEVVSVVAWMFAGFVLARVDNSNTKPS
jgi:hypothetical protein